MKRLHISLGVRDIDVSVRFYSSLFDAAPTVKKADYARWLLDDPRVNFSITTRGSRMGIDHLGIQVEHDDELEALYGHLAAAQGPTIEEGETTCCYAHSEKSWITDPDGVTWEAFLTHGESPTYGHHPRHRPSRRNQGSTVARSDATMPEPCNVLFLCTGNSARSILAEAILNRIGKGRFRAFSAGSFPTGRVNPHALELLQRLDYPTDGLCSKSWDEFTGRCAPTLHFVFSVCDAAAGESCPVWIGQPVTAHWGIPDPAAVDGTDVEISVAFANAYSLLDERIRAFVELPLASLDSVGLQQRLREIGERARSS